MFITKNLLCLFLASFTALHIAAQTPVVPIDLVPIRILEAQDNTGKMTNVATRALSGTGDAALIVGFAIDEGDRFVLVRAVGPSLRKFGVNGVLAKPQIQIIDSSGRVVAEAGAWANQSAFVQAGLQLLARSVGAFLLDSGSEDAAIHVKLPKGSYTVVVSSRDGSVGIALAEVYASQTYGGSV